MRGVICALFVLALTPSAFAGDFDFLRGAQSVGPGTFANWSGFYVGGQIGRTNNNADFSNGTGPPIAYALRETTLETDIAPSTWPVLGTANQNGTTFGGFVGYNSQWQDLVIGLEGNYSHSTISLVAPSSTIARTTPADSLGNTWAVQIAATGTMTNFDYGSLRARAGWILDSFFLPYGFVGLAVGHANLNVTANVEGEQNPPAFGACSAANTPPCYPFSFTGYGGKDGAFLLGLTVGAGMDIALTRNIFVRGEYEYMRFAPISDIVVSQSTIRGGAGFKF